MDYLIFTIKTRSLSMNRDQMRSVNWTKILGTDLKDIKFTSHQVYVFATTM